MTPIEIEQLDLHGIKESLRITYVLDFYGEEPAAADPGRIRYNSPFRPDSHPSFDVFMHTIKGRDKPEERWGDFAEGTQGDVFDLIKRFENCTDSVAYDKGRELLSQQLFDGWDGPEIGSREVKKLDMGDLEYLRDNARHPYELYYSLKRSRPGLPDEVPELYAHPTQEALMFFNKDAEGRIIGVHFRTDTRKWRMAGSGAALIRMELPSKKPVFLTEGETDTWAAWGVLQDDYEVLGVPGVGNRPEKLVGEEFDERTVYLAFDSDDAGRAALTPWANYLRERKCDVRVVVLPEGKDVASLVPSIIQELPDHYEVALAFPSEIIRRGDQYFRPAKNGDVELSNWSFEPSSVLTGEDDLRGFSGVMRPSGREVVLPASVLATAAKLRAWGQKYKAAWFGNDQASNNLLALLDAQSVFLPSSPVSEKAGLTKGSFVWPDGCIGDIDVKYSEPLNGLDLSSYLTINNAPINPVEVFKDMYESQNPAVTGPILAWLAAAPLRTKYKEFPILNISGISGSGKSALTQELLRVFSGSEILTTLTSSSPFAIESTISASNAFPIWFDEYRPGAKSDTKQRLDQLLRDAFTGQESRKGGQSTNLSQVRRITTNAPIVVSGEDSFSETSHIDRMVQIDLSPHEQGDLAALSKYPTGAFAYKFLSYLTYPHPHYPDNIVAVHEEPFLPPTGLKGLSPRQEVVMQVLQSGWRALDEFLVLQNPGFMMPELDLSRVVDAGIESGKTNPVEDLIRWCLENETNQPCAWLWTNTNTGERYLALNATNLLTEARRNHRDTLTLPTSSPQGMNKHFKALYPSGEMTTTPTPTGFMHGGKRARTYRIPLHEVPWAAEHEVEHEVRI